MKTQLNKKGFTLIELLIVVVIIGILAAIAIPRFGQTRERAFISAMQSDLRQVMNSQELYYQQNDFTYFSGADITVDALNDDFDFTPSTGVTMSFTAGEASRQYFVEASHENTDVLCEAYVSYDAPPGSIATVPGVIACDDGSTTEGGGD